MQLRFTFFWNPGATLLNFLTRLVFKLFVADGVLCGLVVRRPKDFAPARLLDAYRNWLSACQLLFRTGSEPVCGSDLATFSPAVLSMLIRAVLEVPHLAAEASRQAASQANIQGKAMSACVCFLLQAMLMSIFLS